MLLITEPATCGQERTHERYFPPDLGHEIPAERAGGTPVDGDVADSWARVALAAAQAEAPEEKRGWAMQFADALAGHRFLPAGRILAGAGTDRNVTLFNCFVMGTIEDDMDAIFAHLREAALTLQQGGGIGYDFSTLRPSGAPVKGVGADASGPVSFMEVWDAMCRTIMSAGSRRGAMMATLACDHPDIESFIDAKRAPGKLSMFNLSVLVSDAFMDAVKSDAQWDLKFGGTSFQNIARARTVGPHHARDLRICRARRDLHRPHQCAEQSRLLRNDQRDQSLRRATAAALRRMSAGLDQSRKAREKSVRGNSTPRRR